MLPTRYLGAVVWALPTLAQFVTPPSPDSFKVVQAPLGITVRYREIPTGAGSVCELDGSVKSYGGFVDVSPHEHIWFWFFESRKIPPQQAPLTAWTSGGPGDASMSELFTEHGPCKVDRNFNIRSNPYSWSNISNMVYIDQPTQVGFSYSDPIPGHINQDPDSCEIIPLPNATCPPKFQGYNQCENYGVNICGTFPSPNATYTANSTEAAAATFYRVMQGLFAAFPQYTNNGFNFGSESYGGHYVPVFSRYIQQQNKSPQYGALQIPLKNVVITNGWLDPAVGYEGYYKFAVDPGNTYGVKFPSKAAENNMKNNLYGTGKCLDRLKQCNSPSGTDEICKRADHFCLNNVQQVYDRQTGKDEYDVREDDPSPYPPLAYVNYLNSDRVQRILGVFTNYTDESVLVGDTFDSTGDDAKELGIIQALADLLNEGIGVSLLHGDSDYSCNWYGGEISAQHIIDATKARDGGRLAAAYQTAGYQNLTTNDRLVHGQVKQAGRFSFVRVYQAGHQVGFFQPLMEQALFNRTLHGQDLATGLRSAVPGSGSLYKSTGPLNSTYYEGNARALPPAA